MWHGCGDYSVDGFFAGRSPRLRELYDAYVRFLGDVGPFDQVPTKSRIAFMVRVRFAGVARLRKDGLVCSFWLKRRIESPRFTRVELVGKHDWIYQWVLRDEEELDDEVRGWLAEAYEVGRQAHLAR
jgi:hypothetical protein